MKYLKKFGTLVLWVIGGALVGYFGAKFGPDVLPSASDMGISKPAAIILILVSLPVGLFISVLLHELGHLLLGIAGGLKPIAMIVGPFSWQFEDGRKWPSLHIVPMMQGGLTVCLPKGEDNLKKGLVYLLVGGPLASLLLTAFCLLALSFAPGWLLLPLAVTAFLTAVLTLYNLYPHTIMGMHTDGARLATVLRGGKPYAEMSAQFQMTAFMISDQGPGCWPQDLIDTLANAEDLSPEWRAGQYYRFYQAKFAEDWDQARALLAKASKDLGDMPPVLKNSYLHEEALFLAVCDFNFKDAAKIFSETGKSIMTQPHSLEIYEAIKQIADGNLVAAEVALKSAEAKTSEALFRGTNEIVHKDIARIRDYLAQSATG